MKKKRNYRSTGRKSTAQTKLSESMSIVPAGYEVDYHACWEHLKVYIKSMTSLAISNPYITEVERAKLEKVGGFLDTMEAIERKHIVRRG